VKVDHGDFDYVGGGALHWHVYGHSLSAFSNLPVGRVDFRYVASPAHHRLHITQLPGLALGSFNVFFNLGIFLKVSTYELGSLLPAETGSLLQAVTAHAVDNTEIDRLSHTAHL
jgi:hypothetical protein